MGKNNGSQSKAIQISVLPRTNIHHIPHEQCYPESEEGHEELFFVSYQIIDYTTFSCTFKYCQLYDTIINLCLKNVMLHRESKNIFELSATWLVAMKRVHLGFEAGFLDQNLYSIRPNDHIK